MARRVAAAMAFVVGGAIGAADAAPFANKTIEIGWVSAGNGRRVGDGTSIRWNNAHQHTIYVSTAGRVFFRRNFSSLGRQGGADRAEIGPDQQGGRGNVRFAGNQIVGTQVQPNGAVQFVVSFDAGYASCSLQVTYGRAGGKMIARGPDGNAYEVDAIQALQPTCRMSEGNAL